jgi:hypothetical protein
MLIVWLLILVFVFSLISFFYLVASRYYEDGGSAGPLVTLFISTAVSGTLLLAMTWQAASVSCISLEAPPHHMSQT